MKEHDKKEKTPSISNQAKNELERLFSELFVNQIIEKNDRIYDNSIKIAEDLPKKVSSTIRNLDESFKEDNKEIKDAIDYLKIDNKSINTSLHDIGNNLIIKLDETENKNTMLWEACNSTVQSNFESLSKAINNIDQRINEIESEHSNKLVIIQDTLTESVQNAANEIIKFQNENFENLNANYEKQNQLRDKKFNIIMALSALIIVIQIINFLI